MPGSLGPVFTMLSWLIVICVAVAVAVGITMGAVPAQETYLAGRLGTGSPQRIEETSGRRPAAPTDRRP
ncbi:hypothetical protein ACFT7S_27745 [Streptomyces sp. NPDC057136]|uniref:hypothetical protein n=1 Tax=Streptomyces sp. NPDC057136 TaxID=3346029 RepID=UPI0036381B2D